MAASISSWKMLSATVPCMFRSRKAARFFGSSSSEGSFAEPFAAEELLEPPVPQPRKRLDHLVRIWVVVVVQDDLGRMLDVTGEGEPVMKY